MADVFISHKSEDRIWAERIDSLLRGKGYSIWWDASLQSGQRYNDEINRELEQAAATIVIWSSMSWKSHWVKDEALFARDRDRLLPTRIDNVQIGVPFYSLQTIDLRNWDGTPSHGDAKRLTDDLERLVPKALREDYSVNVYWTTGDNKYAGNKEKVGRFLKRVTAACSSIGLQLNMIPA
jgi:TIR domain